MTTTSAAPDASRAFDNLAGMRRRHHALLEMEEAPSRDEIQEFLRQGVALGARLDASKDRTEAQGMLSFWASTLTSIRTPEKRSAALGEGLPDSTSADLSSTVEESQPDDVSLSGFVALQPFNKSAADERLQPALDQLKRATPEEMKDIMRLIPFLVRLDGSGGRMVLVRLPEDAAEFKEGADEHKSVSFTWILKWLYTRPTKSEKSKSQGPAAGFKLLKSIGILAANYNANGTTDYSLADESLLQNWELLRTYRDQRVAFRELARGWDRADRPTTALLADRTRLNLAKQYRDLNAIEETFVRESLALSIHLEFRKRGWLVGLVVIVLGGGFGYFAEKNRIAKKEEELRIKAKNDSDALELEDQRRKLDAYDQKVREIEAARVAAETRQIEERKELVAEIENLRKQLTKPLADLKASYPNDAVIQNAITLTEDKFVAVSQRPLDVTLSKPDALTPGAGVKIKSATRSWVATMGIFLKKPGDPKTYLLGPGSLLPESDIQLYRVSSLSEDPKPENLVATFSIPKGGASRKLSAVAITGPWVPDNIVPGIGRITGVVESAELAVASLFRKPVTSFGFASGRRSGRLLRYDPESDTLFLDRTFSVGDAGGPVLTRDGKLVGLLYGPNPADPKESLVQPATSFLAGSGYQILGTTAATNPLFSGALCEMFVAEDDTVAQGKAGPFITTLTAAGMKFPVPSAQTRKRVASTTEVRFFYEEDRDLANAVIDSLKGAGFPEPIRPSFVDDNSAPRKFIQISVAKDKLK